MASTLSHRGPDDEGSWVDADAGVALGHRRLAILDLSSEGHQPMHSADGRYVLVFNGEIYNFRALREELEAKGHTFRGHSDTEVMLTAFCDWGIVPSLQRFVGMFALALWDRRRRTLHLARDRAGEKPLYYGWLGEVLAFGSELKALRAHDRWSGRIDREALALLIRYGYVPAPHCIYENIYKLPPGCVITLTEAHLRARRSGDPTPYWSAETVAETGAAHPFQGNEAEANKKLHELLLNSVTQQMVADVPLGAFLSGGIDSSLVVAMMQSLSRRPIKTFSIGFPQEDLDEAPMAKAVARHLGTDHTELYVQPGELQEVVSQLPSIYDEPLADPSAIPTVLLCRLARTQVTVSLSGDAGDELFAGYDHYRKAQRLWRTTAQVPDPLRRQLVRLLRSLSSAGLKFGSSSGTAREILIRLSNLSDLLTAPTDQALYQMLMSPNRDPRAWLLAGREAEADYGEQSFWERLPAYLQRMMHADFVSYLPDDILVKVDRAAMRASLETRIPLLDHRIIEFACSLPASFKQVGKQGKRPLRQILYQYVPAALVDRPKRGFAAPIAEWLRGSMRDWAEPLLSESRLRQEGFFNAREVRQRWQEHLSSRRDWSPALWHVLMFQAWLEQQRDVPSRAETATVLVA